MKRCPYCAEEIQDAAIKCRFCLSDLPVAPWPRPPQAPAVLPSPEGAASPAPTPSPVADPALPAPSRMSLSQAVMVASVLAAGCYMLLKLVHVSEVRRIRASDASLPLFRALPVSETPTLQRMMPLRVDAQGQPLFSEVADRPKTPRPSADEQLLARQHYFSGLTFYNHGGYDQAKREWEAALAADPENEDAQVGLKRVRQALGETP